MNRTLLIVRSVMMVTFGVIFIVIAIFGDLDIEGVLLKAALAGLGVLIIAFEAWSWKKRLSTRDD
jgi:hypothetical protein